MALDKKNMEQALLWFSKFLHQRPLFDPSPPTLF